MFQAESAMLSRKGMTLVEVLVALVVLLFVSLALMQTALLSIDANMKDSVRDEEVKVAEMRMSDARNLAWTDLTTETGNTFTLPTAQDDQACICRTASDGCTAGSYDDGFPVKVQRHIRNVTINFYTRRVVNTINTVNNEVRIVVRGVYKDKCYSHISTTIVRRPGP